MEIEQFGETPNEITLALKSAFDVMWQAFGESENPYNSRWP
jgi:hypothetical protein